MPHFSDHLTDSERKERKFEERRRFKSSHRKSESERKKRERGERERGEREGEFVPSTLLQDLFDEELKSRNQKATEERAATSEAFLAPRRAARAAAREERERIDSLPPIETIDLGAIDAAKPGVGTNVPGVRGFGPNAQAVTEGVESVRVFDPKSKQFVSRIGKGASEKVLAELARVRGEKTPEQRAAIGEAIRASRPSGVESDTGDLAARFRRMRLKTSLPPDEKRKLEAEEAAIPAAEEEAKQEDEAAKAKERKEGLEDRVLNLQELEIQVKELTTQNYFDAAKFQNETEVLKLKASEKAAADTIKADHIKAGLTAERADIGSQLAARAQVMASFISNRPKDSVPASVVANLKISEGELAFQSKLIEQLSRTTKPEEKKALNLKMDASFQRQEAALREASATKIDPVEAPTLEEVGKQADQAGFEAPEFSATDTLSQLTEQANKIPGDLNDDGVVDATDNQIRLQKIRVLQAGIDNLVVPAGKRRGKFANDKDVAKMERRKAQLERLVRSMPKA